MQKGFGLSPKEDKSGMGCGKEDGYGIIGTVDGSGLGCGKVGPVFLFCSVNNFSKPFSVPLTIFEGHFLSPQMYHNPRVRGGPRNFFGGGILIFL